MYQIWMPSLSVCQSLSELDDIQLKIAYNSAIKIYESIENKEFINKQEMSDEEPLRVLIETNEYITKYYKHYPLFLRMYISLCEEEMQYREGDNRIIKSSYQLPVIYHVAYHSRNHTLYSTQCFNDLEGNIMPINFIMREVLCQRWLMSKVQPVWTRRDVPDWYSESRTVHDIRLMLGSDRIQFKHNSDGTYSPDFAPCMIYQKLPDNKVKFLKVNSK